MEGTNRFSKAVCLSYMVVYLCMHASFTAAQSETSTCPGGVDVSFVMDKSGSVGLRFEFMVDFVIEVMRGLGANDASRFGLIIYSDDDSVTDEFNFNTYATTNAAIAHVETLRNILTGGETHTGLALQSARNMFSTLVGREINKDIAIVITDGKSTNGQQTLVEAQLLKDAGVTVVSIGINLGQNQEGIAELSAMASNPDYVFQVDSFQNLNSILADLCGQLDVIVNACDDQSCSNNGVCTATDDGYTCSCFPGWSGTDCEEDINECAWVTCNYKGTCSQGNGTYTCTCDPGYTGFDCEVNIDECGSSPCANGFCIDGDNFYTCQCFPGWTGVHCEADINYCAPGPCLNGGSCSDGNTTYSCFCLNGWTGRNCEVQIDECASYPCLYGSCVDGINGYTCDCYVGWTGVNCEDDIDYCTSYLCQNGGSCDEANNTFVCNCPDGYSGVYCESDTNECDPDPCANGLCIDDANSYWCSCYTGWTGIHCENDINDCQYVTCNYHGLCIDGNNTYTCICDPDYTGTDCEREIDNCIGVTCNERGICRDGINSYTCDCFSPYSGEHCEVSSGYNCGNNNPCTAGPGQSTLVPFQFYYPAAISEHKFVQCDEHGGCWIMDCAVGTKWNQDVMTCVHDPDYSTDSSGCSCNNRGVCADEIDPVCECAIPYEGEQCQGLTGYNCGNNNPCSPSLLYDRLFYYPASRAANYFIQCSDDGRCFEMPCAPGTIWSQNARTCIHDPFSQCSYLRCTTEEEFEVTSRYDCGDNNPCGPVNRGPPIVRGLFHYPAHSDREFVQCSEWGQCYIMPCGVGTVWSQLPQTCIHDPNANTNDGTEAEGTNNCNANPCREGSDIFRPHDNPQKYIICGAGAVCNEMDCPAGLVWRQDWLTCAFS